MHHELKTLPCYFQAILDGDKNFEIRNTRDRGFQKGDTLLLKEFDPDAIDNTSLTGREISKRVTYVCTYEQKDDFVVMGLAEI